MRLQRIQFRGQEVLFARYDLVFKALLTADGNMELLASLLSYILDLDIRAHDIVVTNTELPPTHEEGRLSRVDVRAKLSDGKNCNIEIQLKNEHNIAKRSLFYTSKLYSDQAISKIEFDELCPAIAINILYFDFLPYEEYHNRYRLKNTRTNDELIDVFEINFIELQKAPKDATDNLKDLWMRFLLADSAEELEMLAKQDPIFEKAVNKLLYVSADEKLRYELDMREKAEMDYWSAMKTNYRKGEQKGEQRGEKRGKQEGLRIVAKNLLSAGDSIEKIIEATGLTREEVESLRDSG